MNSALLCMNPEKYNIYNLNRENIGKRHLKLHSTNYETYENVNSGFVVFDTAISLSQEIDKEWLLDLSETDIVLNAFNGANYQINITYNNTTNNYICTMYNSSLFIKINNTTDLTLNFIDTKHLLISYSSDSQITINNIKCYWVCNSYTKNKQNIIPYKISSNNFNEITYPFSTNKYSVDALLFSNQKFATFISYDNSNIYTTTNGLTWQKLTEFPSAFYNSNKINKYFNKKLSNGNYACILYNSTNSSINVVSTSDGINFNNTVVLSSPDVKYTKKGETLAFLWNGILYIAVMCYPSNSNETVPTYLRVYSTKDGLTINKIYESQLSTTASSYGLSTDSSDTSVLFYVDYWESSASEQYKKVFVITGELSIALKATITDSMLISSSIYTEDMKVLSGYYTSSSGSVGYPLYVCTTSNGTTWTKRNKPVGANMGTFYFNKPNNKCLFTTSSSSTDTNMYYSTNAGQSWTTVSTGYSIKYIAHNNNAIIAWTSTANTYLYSTDGKTWTPKTLEVVPYNVLYNDSLELFIITDITSGKIFYSKDGLNWNILTQASYKIMINNGTIYKLPNGNCLVSSYTFLNSATDYTSDDVQGSYYYYYNKILNIFKPIKYIEHKKYWQEEEVIYVNNIVSLIVYRSKSGAYGIEHDQYVFNLSKELDKDKVCMEDV